MIRDCMVWWCSEYAPGHQAGNLLRWTPDKKQLLAGNFLTYSLPVAGLPAFSG
jgi:hypothetical protein